MTAASSNAGESGYDAELLAAMRSVSPRRRCRIDTLAEDARSWAHVYVSAALPQAATTTPWALYLTTSDRLYRLVCFDLDITRGPVEPDLAHLLDLLDQAGADYVVAASGSDGGRHVWLGTGPEGARPRLVAAVAKALERRLPTLDAGMLLNPKTGAARPPGAPHRSGGRSELLAPLDPQRAAQRLRPGRGGWLLRLAVLLGLDPAALDPGPADGTSSLGMFSLVEPVAETAGPDAGASAPGRSPGSVAAPGAGTSASSSAAGAATRRPARIVRADGASALAGQPRPLAGPGMRALSTVPEGDASAHLATFLVAAALARWHWPQVAALLDATDTVGLLHVRAQAQPSGPRRPRPRDEQRAVLKRQWERAVAYAAELIALPLPDHPTSCDSRVDDQDAELAERVARTAAVITALQAAADADPLRWARPSGPADRGVLDALCLVAAQARRTTVALDVRRAAGLAGVSKSAAARALDRLRRDGWIHLETPADGTRAAVWTLVVTDDRPEPASPGDGPSPADGDPAASRSCSGGTQGTRPPGEKIPMVRPLHDWTPRLTGRAELRGADLFCVRPAGGLGHHAAQTAAALHELESHPGDELQAVGDRPVPTTSSKRSLGVLEHELVRRTGYSLGTVRGHLVVMREYRVATTGGTGSGPSGRRTDRGWQLHPERLERAARLRGVWGYHAQRARIRSAETEAWSWWCDELAWLRAPRREKLPAHGQPELLPLPGARRRGRYPRRRGPGGALVPDHATARRIVLDARTQATAADSA